MSEVLHCLFERHLSPLGSVALVLADDSSPLFVHPESPADVATLPQAAALCHRYLKLGDGDVAITNDPFSGGTTLSDFTLVRGVKIGPGADLLLARRIRLTTRLPLTGRLADEGVRVPPTPLATAGAVNRDLLKAIAESPLAPVGLFAAVESALEDLARAGQGLTLLSRDPRSILGKQSFQAYIEDSSRVFDTFMSRLPLGTAAVSTQLPGGELLKLSLSITEERLTFDFAGSESSTQFALTELATFGACFAATSAALDGGLPMNAGTFHHFQVSAPAKTMLAAAAPAGTYRGMTEGVARVARLAHEALTKLQSAFKSALSPMAEGCYQLWFNGGRSLTFSAMPGSGATPTANGPDGYSPWAARIGARTLSDARWPERMERAYPVRALASGLRAGSGGNGKWRGGHGCVFALAVLEDAELRWQDGYLGQRFEGVDGGRSGTAAAIEIVRAGGAREEITKTSGNVQLKKGDQIYVLSGGGGGFGEPAENDGTD